MVRLKLDTFALVDFPRCPGFTSHLGFPLTGRGLKNVKGVAPGPDMKNQTTKLSQYPATLIADSLSALSSTTERRWT